MISDWLIWLKAVDRLTHGLLEFTISPDLSDPVGCLLADIDKHALYIYFILFPSLSLSPPLRDKAPGQRECDYSIDNINRCIRNIEQASLAAVSQNLASRDDISLEVMIVNETLHALLTHRHPPLILSLSILLSLYPSLSISLSVSGLQIFDQVYC